MRVPIKVISIFPILQKSFLKKYGESFQNVSIDTSENEKMAFTHKHFGDILKTVKNAEDIKVTGKLNFRKHQLQDIDLPKLKHLTLKNNAVSHRVSDFMQNVKLESLELDIDRNHNYVNPEFIEWLRKQDKLKKIVLKNNALKFVINEQLLSAPLMFNLKEVIVKNCRVTPAFCDFIRLQSPTIERFDYEHSDYWFGDEIRMLEQALQGCHNLNHLTTNRLIGFNNTNNNTKFMNLETLIVRDAPHVDYEKIFSCCPNLKSLTLESCRYMSSIYNQNFFQIVSRKLPLLEKLSLHKTGLSSTENYKELNLKNLKEIHISCSSIDHDSWKCITENCPQIEKISLDVFVLNQLSLEVICENLPNLCELSLGRGYFDVNLLNCLKQLKNLRVLRIFTSMYEQYDFNSFGHVRVEVLDDPAVTENEMYYLRQFIDDNVRLKAFLRLVNNFEYLVRRN